MEVTVRSFLSFVEVMGGYERVVAAPDGTTVEGLLRRLLEQHGEPLAKLLWDGEADRPLPYVRLLVNGQDVGFLGGLETELREGDEFTMLPPAGGG